MIDVLFRRLPVAGLLLLLIVAPFPLGGNRDWIWGPQAIFVALLIATVSLGAALDRGPGFPNLRHLWVPAASMVIVLLWAAYQLCGLAPEAWRNAISAWSLAAGAGAPPQAIAIDPARGWEFFLRLLTYLCVFCLAASLGAGSREARTLLAAIVVTASACTGIALAEEVAARIGLFGEARQHQAFIGLNGPFATRSHYAAYAGMAGLLALSHTLSFGGSFRHGGEPARLRWRRRLQFLSTSGGLHLAAFVLLTTGVMMSWSRGAVLAYVVGLVALLTFVAGGAWRWLAYLAVASLLLVAAALLPAVEDLVDRLALLSTDVTGGRSDIWRLTVTASAARPWVGWGLGAFDDLYTVYQSPGLVFHQVHAHNVYLETALELGFPAAMLFFAAIAWLVMRCWRGVRERTQDRHLPAAAFACSSLIAIHSLVDFSVQIHAVALSFAAILGVGWAQSWSSRRADSV